MQWPSDRDAVLSFQYEVYERNFPGFRVSEAFLRDFAMQLKQAVRSPYEAVYVLADGGRVCGFLWIEVRATMVDPIVGYVKNVYVSPDLRGQGYGTMLLQTADDWFQAQGCPKASLDVSVCNGEAIALYRAAGYEVARHRMEKRYH